jgi:multiple sugar transport system permease protein
MTRNQRRKFGRIASYVALSAVCLFILIPFFWMISTSLKPPNEIFDPVPKWIPETPTFENYVSIWFRGNFTRQMVNSIVVAFATTVISLCIAILSGYGLARFKFKGKHTVSILLIVVQMFPGVLLMIPLFTIMNKLGLIDSYLSLIISYCTFAVPFSTWMAKGYFDTIPVSLEESARIDGCNRLGVLWRIIIPLAAPGLVTVAIFAFVLAWQEYIFALTFTRTDVMRTITVGISLMQGQHGSVNWGQIMAGSVIACIPGVVFFTFMEKYLVKGFTLGAVKE